MDKFAKLTGRQYHNFEYAGATDAERVIVVMASGAETAEETVNFLAARVERSALSQSGCTGHSPTNSSLPCCPPL